MTRQTNLQQLPQTPETWHLSVRRLDFWVQDPGQDAYQPDGLLVYNMANELIQHFELMAPDPEPEQVLDELYQGMLDSPMFLPDPPHRPSRLQVEDPALLTYLAPRLAPLEIDVLQGDSPPQLDTLIDNMARDYAASHTASLPGVLSREGVTPRMIRDLFRAASSFYLAAPWKHLDNLDLVKMVLPPDPTPRYLVIMGHSGVEYGINVFLSWEGFRKFITSEGANQEKIPDGGMLTLFFSKASELPPDDLALVKKYGWQVINKQCYPSPLQLGPDGSLTRPGPEGLHILEAALKAVPRFVNKHLPTDNRLVFPFTEASFTVNTFQGETKVTLTYPAGIPSAKAETPAEEREEPVPGEPSASAQPPLLDPRALEGDLRVFRGQEKDTALALAQDLMYRAWDEPNHALCIMLAREALTVSPDCADAYVMLAELEADTLARAMALYRAGVQAGERALGEAFFAEHEGHFWGLLETRPYMRALHGLATTCWDAGAFEEAAALYRNMLRLNPGDNQGARYQLLPLLMEMENMEEADALLAAYEGDISPEWAYTRALRLFQQEQDTARANQALAKALEYNPHVPDLLLKNKPLPDRLPVHVTFGGEDEAAHYVVNALPLWWETPGALAWLEAQAAG